MRTISMLALIIMMTSLPPIARGQVFGAVGGLHVGESLVVEGGLGVAANLKAPLGEEVKLDVRELIVGASISGEAAIGPIFGGVGTLWLDLFPLSLAASIAYYVRDGDHALKLRPEIGIGILGSRISYALAIPLSGAEIEGANRSEIVLKFFIPFVPVILPRLRLGH